ncbi:GTPase activating protein [Pholiota conissans]|uniref:GTPase activating protein n=1 Tax=Pholiota conissans TaxID=109636 RepID=A0A9P6CV80_9AGAR|nr:GTPase activating protein [Pholiota conissans]
MQNSWDHHASVSSDTSREFLVSVELYISNAAGATLRKPLTDRKKPDKRGSSADDVRMKDKSSANWLSLQKNLHTAGHWRSATCRLLEEGDRCLLNVYVDESILYQTVYVHLLNQTDIRQTDTSMFYRKDCLSVFCIAGQRWTSSTVAEPIYLQFPNSDTCSTWQALLKSYAIPEIYGRWFFPMDGGSYRMWRQVELTVIQGRNLGLTRYTYGTSSGDNPDNEGPDVDLSCEIHLNDILCSRTTAKKGLGSPDWHESFIYPGLPPFENLDIVVWREKKLYKPVVVGTTRVPLTNFRRGDTVEGWFPVVQAGAIGNEVQYGDLRLKIRVDEEIILPYSSYSKLMQTCNSRNFLDWMSDLESRLKLKSVSSHLMSIAVATNVVIEQIQDYASREVENSATSLQTLFRGNTTLTKTVELCMAWYGKAFLEASIGSVLRRLCAEKIAIEVDPMRSGKGTKDVERNVEQLIYWCNEFWNQIYSVRSECPNEMRILFRTIRKLVEQYSRPDPSSTDNHYLPWQSVSAFCFLRFIAPAILHPHLFGLVQGLPSVPVQRSLTLIAKVIQSLANLNSGVQKESFMRGIQDFLRDSHRAMEDYLRVVSTPTNESMSSSNTMSDIYRHERHERLNVVHALRQRKKTMTTLDREAVLNLPHLVDVPKHLAIISSAVIRNSRELNARPRTGDDTDLAVDEFCSRCFEVEEEALLRVGQLATKLASGRPNIADGSNHRDQDTPRSPGFEVTSTVISTNAHPTRARRKSLRPSTAPSPAGLNDSSHRQIFSGNEAPPSNHRTVSTITKDEHRLWTEQNIRTLHHKSPSIDSFPPAAQHNIQVVPVRLPRPEVPLPDSVDDSGKRKKGLLRGILRR